MCGLVLSLFPGIGLLDRAFEEEGFTVVRGPDVLWGGDVRRFHPPAGRFDGVIGGPPCQAFSSLAHLVRANGHEPRFGNLIPEYERCVREAAPAWFLMEEVRAAPLPYVEGYGIKDFLWCNSWVCGEDGYGQEQMRTRRITFGARGLAPIDLRRWLTPCALLLPGATGTVTQWTPDNTPDGGDKPPSVRDGPRYRQTAVTGSDGGSGGMRPMRRYGLADACRLQGLPEDFLSDAPFTAAGKLKAVANGVPLPLGRALARAVKKAITQQPRED